MATVTAPPLATYGAPTAPAAAPTPATAPALGYGNKNSADINTVNQWMRQQPWYQALLKSFGQDPNNVHLNDSQKQAVIKAAQANGIVVDEGHNGQDVDDSGNFEAKSSLGKNILIGAAIGGLALTGLGAAGIGPLAGVLGAGEAAGGAAAAGGAEAAADTGVLASTALPATGALATGAAASGAVPAALAGGAGAAGATYGAAAIPGVAGSSLTGDLLKYGLPTAGGIVGGLIQANAAGKASDAQTAYLNQALQYAEAKDAYSRDLEGSRYATYSSNIAPYVANGATATSKMASLLGLPATNTPAPSVAPPPTFTGPTGAPPATAPTTTSGPQSVTMRAPDGSTRQVAAADVAAAQAKGAQVVS